MNNSKLIFDLELDVNNVLKEITMNSSDKQARGCPFKIFNGSGLGFKN